MSFKLARPEDEGIAPHSIQNFLDTCEKEIQYLYSFAVVKNENIVASGYYAPMTREIRKIMHSVSKSVNSLAVGIAIDEGKLGLEDKVLDYFRDKLPPQYDERFEELRVKHLLMMSSNSAYTSASFVNKGGDWLTHYLSLIHIFATITSCLNTFSVMRRTAMGTMESHGFTSALSSSFSIFARVS